MTDEQRFEQYRTELDCVIEIVALWKEEQAQRACNRLAAHVRQQEKICANTEMAIVLIEQAMRAKRDAEAALAKAVADLADEQERSRVLRGMLEAPEASSPNQ